MSKPKKSGRKKSIVLLTILGIFLALWSVLSFLPFEVGVKDYISVSGAIPVGKDFDGGSYAEVEVKRDVDTDGNYVDSDEVFADKLQQTVNILKNRLKGKGFADYVVALQNDGGDYSVRLEIPKSSSPETLLSTLGSKGYLEFKYKDGTQIIDGSDIEKAVATYDNSNNPAIAFLFTETGKNKIAEATTVIAAAGDGENVMPIYVDDVEKFSPTVSQAMTEGSIVMNVQTVDEAVTLALLIEHGSLPLDVEVSDVKAISPAFGSNALTALLIAGGISLALLFAALIIFYKGFGLIADISLIIFFLLMLLAMTIVPNLSLTVYSVAAFAISLVFVAAAHIFVIEKVREEYKLGKSIKASVITAFKRSSGIIIDTHLLTLIISIISLALFDARVYNFAVMLAVGTVLSAFVSIVITRRVVAKLILGISRENNRFYGVYRANEDKASKISSKEYKVNKNKKKMLNVSAAIILAGILIAAIFGFNLSYETGKNNSQTYITIGSGLTSPQENDSNYNAIADGIKKITSDYAAAKKLNITFDRFYFTGVASKTGIDFKYKINNSISEQDLQNYNAEIETELADKLPALLSENGIAAEDQSNLAVSVKLIEGEYDAALWVLYAFLIAFGATFLYMLIRFKLLIWLSAAIATVHDILILLAITAITRFPINMTFFAGMLAVIFLSLLFNLITFDKARENFKRLSLKDEPFTSIVERSVRETMLQKLAIAIITAALFVSLVILGGSAIELSVLMIVAAALVLYSSSFISTSVYILFKGKYEKEKAKRLAEKTSKEEKENKETKPKKAKA